MRRTYFLAALAVPATVLAGWAAIALAQSSGGPMPAPVQPPAPFQPPVPIAPAPFPPIAPPAGGNENPAPIPLQPGTVPAPAAPVTPTTSEVTTQTPQQQSPIIQANPQPPAASDTTNQDPGNPTGRQEPAV